MKAIVLFLAFFITSANDSQNYNQVILKQANEMGAAFLKEDYKAFAKFTYPKLIQLMGGEDQMVATLKKTINDVKQQGVNFLNISFDNPTKIIKVKNELQCTIKQHLIAKTPNGDVTNSSTLIAVSLDNGKKWFFIDTTKKDIRQIKTILPNLSNEIHF